MSGTATALTYRGAPFDAPAKSPWTKPRGSDEREVPIPADGDTFAGLLNAVSVSPTSTQAVEVGGAKGMFEAPAKEGRQGRLETLTSDARADALSGRADARFEQASVTARRKASVASAESRLPDSAATPSALDSFGVGFQKTDRGSAVTQDAVQPDSQPAPRLDAGRVVPGPRQDTPGLRGRANQTSPIANSGTHVGSQPAAESTTSVTPSASSSPTTQTSLTRPAQPAGQIAQILAGRGEGETGRTTAFSPGPGAQDARSSSTSRESSASKSTGESDRPGSSSQSKESGEPLRPGAFDDLVRSIRLRTADRFSSARLHLDPPELGRMRVDVRLEGDALQVDVHTETPEARNVVHERINQLRLALAHAGVTVDRIDVNVNPNPATADFSAGGFDSGDVRQRESSGEGPRGARSSDESKGAEVSRSVMETGSSPTNPAWRRIDIRI
ncbi:MAG: flagellar hook-length control protein FliK [Phycisphaerae bacterium]|nr:flagellar hook-length control protein FliK [Phycisphaerae bacterium]